jgi:epoxide hydrolase 4
MLQTNGICLHTIQAGPEDGPLVILLHGFPEFWRGWKNQIPALAEAGLRVVVPDQRGYNLSDKPRGVKHYALRYLVADVIGLMEALGREKCFLVGHDWGAAVAWETALRCPLRVEKLAILNVPHLDVMTRFVLHNMEQRLKSWYIYAIQVPWLPEALLGAKNWRLAGQMLQRNGQADTFHEADLEYYRQAWRQPGAMTGMLNWYRAVFRSALGAVLRGSLEPRLDPVRRLRMPVLILWGEKDVALSLEMARPSLDLCDQGELVTFPNATHWVQHDEAAEVNRRLMEFFRSPETFASGG